MHTQVSLGPPSRQEVGVRARYKMFPHGQWCEEAKTGGANKCYHVHIITCPFPVRANDFSPSPFFPLISTHLCSKPPNGIPLYSE